MEVDVLYNVPKDLCWQYVNRFVRPASVNLALYRACIDPYVVKKTVHNAAGRLAPGGIFVIQTCPEFISHLITLVEGHGFGYETFYVAYEGEVTPILIGYKSELNKPGGSKLILAQDYIDLGQRYMRLSQYGDIVLVLGDDMLQFIPIAKRLGRGVIAFGADPQAIREANNEGVHEVQP